MTRCTANMLRRGPILIVLVVTTLAADPPPAPDWPAELAPALAAYRSGRFDDAQRMCAELGSGQLRLRGEAAAIDALCLIVSAGTRSERLDALARLSQLVLEDPTLARRPECHLAFGIGQTALFETADALDHLDHAVTEFRRQHETDRVGVALLALAEAWSVHNEWPLTPMRLRVPQRPTPAEAHDVRQARMSAARDAASELPDATAFVDAIDVVIARYLLRNNRDSEEALAALERLARGVSQNRAGIDAALILAERHEAAERWSAALEHYDRVAATTAGDLAQRASDRAAAIRRPELDVTVTRAIPANEGTTIGMRCRNVARVAIEIRRIDLKVWLTAQRGRFIEAQLTLDGPVHWTSEILPTPTDDYATWDATTLAEPLRIAPPIGAYVVVARGAARNGESREIRRLLLVSDLRATLFSGRRDAVLWVTGVGSVWSGPTPKAEFWMHRSFVPARPPIENGVARFPLPNEARVLRDRRWCCLVESGEHLALCDGELTDATDESTQTQVALLAAPPAPVAGEKLTLAGILLRPSFDTETITGPRDVQLEVRDALERVFFSQSLAVSDGNAFFATIPIEPAMAGKDLRVIVRSDGRVLEHAWGRGVFRIPPVDASPLDVAIRMPTRIAPDAPMLVGRVTATYPWGTPAAGCDVSLSFRAVDLSAADGRTTAAFAPILQRGSLDALGRLDFSLPLTDFQIAGRPMALRVWATITGWDARPALAQATTIAGSDAALAWCSVASEPATIGDAVRFSVSRFDPGNQAAGPPKLTIHAPEGEAEALALRFAADGAWYAMWTPQQPGPYEAVVALPLLGGATVERRLPLRVAPRPESQTATAFCSLTATRATIPGAGLSSQSIDVALHGQVTAPLLIVADDGEPRAAATIASLDGDARVQLQVDSAPTRDIHVRIFADGGSGHEQLAEAVVPGSLASGLRLRIEPPTAATAPGSTVTLRVACANGASDEPAKAIFVARVIDNASEGGVRWVPGVGGAASAEFDDGPFPTRETDRDTSVEGDSQQPGRGVLDEAARSAEGALRTGATLALAHGTIDGVGEIAIALPVRPGRFLVLIIARDARGRFATEEVEIDATNGLHATAALPARLTTGDRSQAFVEITNAQSEPRDVSASIEMADTLRIDSVRGHSSGREVRVRASEHDYAVSVPPNGRVTLIVDVVAARPGPSTLSATVSSANLVQVAVASGAVVAASDSGNAQAAVRIRRTLLLMRRAIAPAPDSDAAMDPTRIGGEPPSTEWEYEVLAANDEVPAGSMLLIRDDVTLDARAFAGVDSTPQSLRWSQSLPPCFVRIAPGAAPEHPLGRLDYVERDRLTWIANDVAPGVLRHEFVVVALRPGEYSIIAPTVQAGAMPLACAMQPGELRIRVTAPHASGAE